MSTSTIQDRHLDMLLSMALEQIEQEADESLLRSPDPKVDPDDALRADRAFESAYVTAQHQERRKRRIMRTKKAAHGLRLASAAAVIIVFLTMLAFPLALTASAEFRAYVMQMLVHIDEERREVSILFLPEEGTNTGSAPLSPDCWKGHFFPQYIPEGFIFSGYDEQQNMAVFTSSIGQQFIFTENKGTMPPVEIPEGALYLLEYLQGGDFPIVEEYAEGVRRITVTWEKEGYWFLLITKNMEREEALRIAESAQTVVEVSAFNIELKKTNPSLASVGVPDWWIGSYYPTAIPEDMKIISFGVTGKTVKFYGNHDKYILFSESDAGEAASFAYRYGKDVDMRNITINGGEGFLSAVDEGENQSTYIVWQQGGVILLLNTQGLSADEAITLAESTTKLDHRTEGNEKPTGILILRDEMGVVIPPKEWNGCYFPAYLPEGFFLDGMNEDATSYEVTLTEPAAGQFITLKESIFFPPDIPYLDIVTDIRLALIGERQALLAYTADAAGSALTVYWQPGNDRWMELKSNDLAEDMVLRIAESVQQTTQSPYAEDTNI